LLEEGEEVSTGAGVGISDTIIPELDKRLKGKTEFNEIHDTVRKHLGTLFIPDPHDIILVGREEAAGVALKLDSLTEVTSLEDAIGISICLNEFDNFIIGRSADRHDLGLAAPAKGEVLGSLHKGDSHFKFSWVGCF